jgi:DNA polymerase-1
LVPWYSEVYETDKQVADICRAMQLRGFMFDQKRAAVLREGLEKVEARCLEAAFNAASCEPFKLGSPKKLWAAFRGLGAPILFRSARTGQPSLAGNALLAYSTARDERIRNLAVAVLEYRNARLVRRGFIERIVVNPATGRVHPTWSNYKVITGRWACSKPNLMNLPSTKDPTAKLGGIKSVYVPAPGYRLVQFDMSQIEPRIAAYASGDSTMIANCETADYHGANATMIWPEVFDQSKYDRLKDDPAGKKTDEFKLLKKLRQISKKTGLAVNYLAEAQKVWATIVNDGVNIRLTEVEVVLKILKRRFRGYYQWQDARLLDCMRTGYVESPILGRRRVLGHNPKPTEAANYPIQSGAADFMNLRTVELVGEIAKRKLGAHLVAQVHDNLVLETIERDVDAVSDLCYEVFERPQRIRTSGLSPVFPIELEVCDRWQ